MQAYLQAQLANLTQLAPWVPAPGFFYQALTGTWKAVGLPSPPPQLQTWVSGQSPLSTHREVVAAVATYLLVIFGGRELMRSVLMRRNSCSD